MTTHPNPAGLPSLHHGSQSAAPAASFKPARVQMPTSRPCGMTSRFASFPGCVQETSLCPMAYQHSASAPLTPSALGHDDVCHALFSCRSPSALSPSSFLHGQPGEVRQPTLGHRSVPVLTVDGLQFKDLNRNGKLDKFEDWRLSPEERADDLLLQLTIADMAGLMVHGTLPAIEGAEASIGRGSGYDPDKSREFIAERRINTFITLSEAIQQRSLRQITRCSRLRRAPHLQSL